MSNTDIMSSDYNDPEFVQEAMNVLPPESVMAFFEDLGVLAFEEDEGRIYLTATRPRRFLICCVWA